MLCDVLYAVLCALLYAAVPVDVLELDGFESEDELDGLESEEADDFDDALRAARRGAAAVVAVEAGALETMPTADKTSSRRPPQLGHSVRASSVDFCTASRPSPHSVHWYW
ncbi:hypothetical protein SGLAM104S_04406 [Streptomyces glaucescens]